MLEAQRDEPVLSHWTARLASRSARGLALESNGVAMTIPTKALKKTAHERRMLKWSR